MDINTDARAIHVGNAYLTQINGRETWKMNYVCENELQTREGGRVYYIVVDGEIHKIGQSEARGGIRGTISPYMGGDRGSPSLRTFGVHTLILQNLRENREVSFWIRPMETTRVTIHGINRIHELEVTSSAKHLEEVLRKEYKELLGRYPPWNFQENGGDWPREIHGSYMMLLSRGTGRN